MFYPVDSPTYEKQHFETARHKIKAQKGAKVDEKECPDSIKCTEQMETSNKTQYQNENK